MLNGHTAIENILQSFAVLTIIIKSSFSGGLVCCNIDANCSSKLGSQTQSIDADYSVHILDHAQASFYEIKDKCQAGVTEGS